MTVTCVHLFRTGLLMICYLRLGILLSKEGFIFLDLVHQRKRAIMRFVRLETVTFINDTFNFYWLDLQTQALKPWTWLTINVCVVYFPFLWGTRSHWLKIVHLWNRLSPTRDKTFLDHQWLIKNLMRCSPELWFIFVDRYVLRRRIHYRIYFIDLEFAKFP